MYIQKDGEKVVRLGLGDGNFKDLIDVHSGKGKRHFFPDQ